MPSVSEAPLLRHTMLCQINDHYKWLVDILRDQLLAPGCRNRSDGQGSSDTRYRIRDRLFTADTDDFQISLGGSRADERDELGALFQERLPRGLVRADQSLRPSPPIEACRTHLQRRLDDNQDIGLRGSPLGMRIVFSCMPASAVTISTRDINSRLTRG